MNIAVYVLGVLALFFVCLVIVFHLHIVVKQTKWYNTSLPVIQAKFNLKDNWKSLSQSFTNRKQELAIQMNIHPYTQFQESYYEQM